MAIRRICVQNKSLIKIVCDPYFYLSMFHWLWHSVLPRRLFGLLLLLHLVEITAVCQHKCVGEGRWGSFVIGKGDGFVVKGLFRIGC